MSQTWYVSYITRAQCSTCSNPMWCSTSGESVACACGAALLHSDGSGANTSSLSDADMKAHYLTEKYDAAGLHGPADLESIVLVAE